MQIPGLHISADTAALPWRETRVPGIAWLPLTEGRGEPADTTALIRMAPGCGYPPHRHLDVEEVLVLEGSYRDEEGVYPAGSYVRYAKGSEHAPVACGERDLPEGEENPACILFAVARGGVELLDS